MALQSSGAISFNNINVELGVAGTTSASLNQASYRTLAGVASGAISLSNFYGKSAAPAGTSVTVSYPYTFNPGGEPYDEQTYTVLSAQYNNPGFSINGVAVSTIYMDYNYFNDTRTSEIALVGALPKNHFTSISGNGVTLYTASTSYYAQNSNNTTTWLWYGSLFIYYPLNKTSGSTSTVITYV